MAAVFEVWDVQTGNLVGAYDTEREALVTVCRTLRRFGDQAAEHLALAREDDDGRTFKVAEGAALARKAKDCLDPARRGGHRPGASWAMVRAIVDFAMKAVQELRAGPRVGGR